MNEPATSRRPVSRVCRDHPDHIDDCLNCAIDRAIERSPEEQSKLGLAKLIPDKLLPAYFERIVSNSERKVATHGEAGS